MHVAHATTSVRAEKPNNADLCIPRGVVVEMHGGYATKYNKRKMVCQGRQTPRRKEEGKKREPTRNKNVAKEFVEPWVRGWVGRAMGKERRSSCIADDDARALLAEHTPFFGLGAPVAALFATEEAEHARGLFRLRSLHERRALVSHLGP